MRVGDEWAPADLGPDEMVPRLTKLARLCEQECRALIPTSMFAATEDHRTLEIYERSGVHRAVYVLPSLPGRGEMERELDRLEAIATTYGR